MKTYTGVGGTDGKRANSSLKKYSEVAKKQGYSHVGSSSVNVQNRKTGYIVEQLRIDINGGASSASNFNKINSPGKKLMRSILKVIK